VARWDPGTEQRLTQAALDLFGAHGYDDVTITQIAERAGITRRSYFRYFPDKREVLFARSEQLPPAVADAVLAVDEHADPLSAALRAITEIGTMLVTRTERAAERHAIISASPELRERDRTKVAAIAAAIEDALRHRGSTPAEAKVVAQIAAVVFENAYLRWIDAGELESFAACMRDVAATIHDAVTGSDDLATESQ
jgi:AcrR family transcriptional regulator